MKDNILKDFFTSLASVIRIKLNSNEEYKPIELADAIEQIDSTTSGSIYPDLTCYIPGGITEIETVIIGENATKINMEAYRSCTGLKEVIILGNLKSIGQFSFDGCTKLETIKIPDSVTTIDAYAFRSCSKLKEINVPASIKRIGDVAFEGAAWYSNKENNSLVYFGPILYKVKGDVPNDGNIIINSGTISITANCFKNKNIKSIQGEVLENIAQECFYNCQQLEEAFFYQPEGNRITLGTNVFSGCSNLKTLYFDNLSILYKNATSGCDSLTDLYIMNKYELPSTLDISAHKDRIILHVHPNLIDKWKSKFNGYNIIAYEENE